MITETKMSLFFGLKKLKLFHKIWNNIIPVTIPEYFTLASNRRHSNGMLKVETNNRNKDVISNFSSTYSI